MRSLFFNGPQAIASQPASGASRRHALMHAHGRQRVSALNMAPPDAREWTIGQYCAMHKPDAFMHKNAADFQKILNATLRFRHQKFASD
ncbi:HPr (plasmid) [Ralstonia solanacearum]|nr:HPr [Ralstonia solanacearum]